MDKFILFDEPDAAAAPEEIVEEPEETGPDYSQLLYDYMVERDSLQAEILEKSNAAYMEKLDAINSNLEWCVALLVFAIVLYLRSHVRGWVTMLTGGMKDVH